jgi:hypothetical protein
MPTKLPNGGSDKNEVPAERHHFSITVTTEYLEFGMLTTDPRIRASGRKKTREFFFLGISI